MANSSASTALGVSFDTETVSSNGDHRQVICVGDKSTEGSVASVDGTAGLAVMPRAFTTGGCSIFHLVSAATTNATRIKSGAGQIYAVSVSNRSAGQYSVYVKFHDSNSNPPTAGTGVVWTVAVQSGTDRYVQSPLGASFTNGIGITIVKDVTDAGTTAVASGDCVVDVFYK